MRNIDRLGDHHQKRIKAALSGAFFVSKFMNTAKNQSKNFSNIYQGFDGKVKALRVKK